jgi:diketogulonate reductase-like aldo/keto reductase
MNVEYVDLYLVHWPMHFVPSADKEAEPVIASKPPHIIWAEMEEAYNLKLTRAIGVSNYNV